MIEDKLLRSERVRLEALAQAIALSAIIYNDATMKTILERAEEIEKWLYRAKDNTQ